MVENALLQLLRETPAVTLKCSDRVYPGMRPQNERRACLVLTRVKTTKFPTMQGTSKTERGVIQCDALAPEYGEAKELAAAVSSVLEGYSGSVAGTTFHWCQIDDASDIPMLPLEGKAEPTFGVSLEIQFMATVNQP